MHYVLDLREMVADEIVERRQSGYVVDGLAPSRVARRLHADGLDWERARDATEQRHGTLNPVHAINNAAVVAAALLCGEGDFTRTVGLAVRLGRRLQWRDRRLGVRHHAGAGSLPSRWVEPLEDRVRSALFGFDGARISELAERTLRVAAGPDR